MKRYHDDCEYYNTNGQRLRPYCQKLEKEIRPYNCSDCGWYTRRVEGIGAMTELDPVVVRLLRNHPREELGLEDKA